MELIHVVGLAVTFCSLVSANVPLMIRDCGAGENTPLLRLNAGNLNPDPIKVPGITTATGSVTVDHEVTGGLDLEVTIQRKVTFFWVTVPCVSNVGSCKYDACQLISVFNTTGCPPQMVASGIPCTCDTIKAGVYTMNSQEFIIPELSGVWSWLASGDYKVDGTLKDRSTHETVACLHVEATIVDGNACDGFLCSIFG